MFGDQLIERDYYLFTCRHFCAHARDIRELTAKCTFALLKTIRWNGFFAQCILHVHLFQVASEKRVHLLKYNII